MTRTGLAPPRVELFCTAAFLGHLLLLGALAFELSAQSTPPDSARLSAIEAAGGGPPGGGGETRVIAVDPHRPGTVYASFQDHLVKSTNAGNSWRDTAFDPTRGVSFLAIDPSRADTVYVSTNLGGLFKTTDGGQRWTELSAGRPFGQVRQLVFDPNDANVLYAKGDAAVFQSADGGTHWTPLNVDRVTDWISQLAIARSFPTATLYVGMSRQDRWRPGGLIKSTDRGQTWTDVALPGRAGAQHVAIDPSEPMTLYVATNKTDPVNVSDTGIVKLPRVRAGLFRSTDVGKRWTTISAGLPDTVISGIQIDPFNPSTLYVIPTDGWGVVKSTVFKSTDRGTHWTAANTGLPHTEMYSLAIDPTTPDTLFVGTNGAGVFKSSNGGVSWNPASTGIAAATISALAVRGSTLYAARGNGESGGIFRSTDEGQSWTTAYEGLTNTGLSAIAVDPSNTMMVYASTQGGLFKSRDGGRWWTASNTGLPQSSGLDTITIDPSTPSTVYAAATCGGIYKTLNGGERWTPLALGVAGAWCTSGLVINLSEPTTVFTRLLTRFSVPLYGIMKSTDAGKTWRVISAGLPHESVAALATDPSTAATMYARTDTRLFRSADGGESWAPISANLPYVFDSTVPLLIDPSHPETLYTGVRRWDNTHASGVFKSTDGGGTWFAMNTGLANSSVNQLVMDHADPATLYAGTKRGVFKSSNGGISWQPTSRR